MSKAFTSEETPDASIIGRAVRRAEPGTERPITADGHRALTAELRRLVEEERPRLRSLIDAMEREAKLAELDHRVALLQATLASVRIAEATGANVGQVCFGSRVTIEWEGGRQQRLHIVGPDEADAKAGRISIDSPLARSLMAHVAGDEVEVERPRGVEGATIIGVA